MTFPRRSCPRRSLPTPGQHHTKESLTVRVSGCTAFGLPARPLDPPLIPWERDGGRHGQTRLACPCCRKFRLHLLGAHVDGPDQRRSPWSDSRSAREERSSASGESGARSRTQPAAGIDDIAAAPCAAARYRFKCHASSARRGPFVRIRRRNRTSPVPRPGQFLRRHALPAIPNPEPSVRLFFVPRSAIPRGSASRRRQPGSKEIHQWPTRC